MEFRFLRALYPKSVLLKSAYQFTNRAYIHLDADDLYYIVTIEYKENLCFDYRDFENEMLVQSVRHEVLGETKEIRTLTVARALSSTLIENTASSDSVDGCPEDGAEDDSFLISWFDENADEK